MSTLNLNWFLGCSWLFPGFQSFSASLRFQGFFLARLHAAAPFLRLRDWWRHPQWLQRINYKNLDPSEFIQNGINPKKLMPQFSTICSTIFDHLQSSVFLKNQCGKERCFLEPRRFPTIFLLGSSGPPFDTRNTCPLSCRS